MNVASKPILGKQTPTALRTHRFFRGITQAALAKQVNVDTARISRLENNLLRDTPATVRLKGQVADLFGVAVDELFQKGGQED